MAGLVLEGGTLRGIFTAGVLDAMLDYDIHFDYVIGVSAGITNGLSYVSNQRGRNIDVMMKYRNDHRYLSKRNFFKYRSIFGLEFVFDEIPNKLVPFDWESYYNFNGKVVIGMTDAKTGKIVYSDGKKIKKNCDLIRASCAIPIYFPPVMIDGSQYFDGGLADSIPIKQSINDGNTKNLVILTQPQGYKKKHSKSTELASKLLKLKYPKLAQVIKQRADKYNETIEYIEKLKTENIDEIVVLQPNYQLNSFESDLTKLKLTYDHGYDLAVSNIEKIKKLLK